MTDVAAGGGGPLPIPPTPAADVQFLQLSRGTRTFYRDVMRRLDEERIPFMVGGAYALARYTGIERDTKDFDVFVQPSDAIRALKLLDAVGSGSELTFPHWLGKVWRGRDFIDIIFSSGNGIATVDGEWFANAPEDDVLGTRVRLCPAEEILWSKAFVMERERFDGADVNHLLLHLADRLDWHRLLRRFGENWPVLFAHLTLYRFAYPGDAHRVPSWVMAELLDRSRVLPPPSPDQRRSCRGTLLSRAQYLIDINEWGFRDSRLPPGGTMSEDQVAHWTAAIDTAR